MQEGGRRLNWLPPRGAAVRKGRSSIMPTMRLGIAGPFHLRGAVGYDLSFLKTVYGDSQPYLSGESGDEGKLFLLLSGGDLVALQIGSEAALS
jgi:hypothetical protein